MAGSGRIAFRSSFFSQVVYKRRVRFWYEFRAKDLSEKECQKFYGKLKGILSNCETVRSGGCCGGLKTVEEMYERRTFSLAGSRACTLPQPENMNGAAAAPPPPAVDPNTAKPCHTCQRSGFKKYNVRQNAGGELCGGSCSKCRNSRRDDRAAGRAVAPVAIGRPPGAKHAETKARRDKRAEHQEREQQRQKRRRELENIARRVFVLRLCQSHKAGEEARAAWQTAPNHQREADRAEAPALRWLTTDGPKIAAAITAADVEEAAADARALVQVQADADTVAANRSGGCCGGLKTVEEMYRAKHGEIVVLSAL